MLRFSRLERVVRGSPARGSWLVWAPDWPMRTMCREFGVHFCVQFRSGRGWAGAGVGLDSCLVASSLQAGGP